MMMDADFVDKNPSIIKTVTIWGDSSWKLRVHERDVKLHQFLAQLQSHAAAVHFLELVHTLSVCGGVTTPKYMPFVKEKGVCATKWLHQ